MSSSTSLFTWSPKSPDWSSEELALLPTEITQPDNTTLNSFLQKSDSFSCVYPIDSNRCKTLKETVGEDILERNINSAYPILHQNVLHLCARFILHKRKNGTAIEKSLYKNMNVLQLVDRLLTKRAATFMGKRDTWILMNGKKGIQNWESIGTEREKAPLVLKDCLSYHEIKLAAFLSVSSYTYFVNKGDRKNFGVFNEERETIQDEGIIMGIIGPRLIKDEVMEFEELIITPTQNTKEKGYGEVSPPTIHHLFAEFYDDECLEFSDVLAKKKALSKTVDRYTDIKNTEILDNSLYYKRLIFTMDTLFIEANQRALEKNTTAYIHVVGIGLGVWKRHPCQNKIFMNSCGQRIKQLGKHLHNVSDVCFAYINHDACLTYKDGDVIPIEGHPNKGIKIHINKRDPHSRLTGSDKNKLLVVSYAWDGNALPGNEYWKKKLGSSGDSAAASSTQITEIHNPMINPKICAENLKVVVEGRVVGIGEYVKEIHKGKKRKVDE